MLITSDRLRTIYRDFFVERGHVAIPSGSLVPTNDPSVLFTTAGMHPLVPHLLGLPHPSGARLTNVQKCVRTGDIDVVGDDTHLTFFEMLGNWSLGDYGREQTIQWSFELLTGKLGVPLERFGVTCFHEDETSIATWRRLGLPRERIQLLGHEDNWWGPAGKTGPCGPDTEMFYWVGSEPPPSALDVRDRRWVEIWNDVFMGFTKTAEGTLEPLTRPNVDTGMGLERMLVALNGFSSVYEVDTIEPLFDRLRGFTNRDGRERELRIVTDHMRAAWLMIADGVHPSNKDRGYVLRRLLRRSMVFARQLGSPPDWHVQAIDGLPPSLKLQYPEIESRLDDIRDSVAGEMSKFQRTLSQGLKLLERLPTIDGKVAFDLFQTHGFPFELTCELALVAGKSVDGDSFRAELEEHRRRSRPATSAIFEGGLADRSVEIVRYHTLTHLLQSALRIVLGEHVIQRGSNITRERLRFDFSHEGKVEPSQLRRVEELVNGWLRDPLVVTRATMTESEARALGALGAFGEKYGPVAVVYTIENRETGAVVSRELCGGPHVASTRELSGRFTILREGVVSSGVHRIKAVLG